MNLKNAPPRFGRSCCRPASVLPLALLLTLLLALTVLTPAQAQGGATLPPDFIESLVATALVSPTNMQFAPDGRLFVLEQAGRVRIIQNDILLPAPFLTLANVDSSGERGLLGLTFDPNFAANNYIYLYYAVNGAPTFYRLSRFTANGNVVQAGSEVVLVTFPPVNAPYHHGGTMHFGPDGRLYLATGDDWNTPDSQDLNSTRGKILRYNSDGTIPNDNPFGPANPVWAYGFRNPFQWSFQPGSGRMYINDVGSDYWEEINQGVAGGNFGWALYEGYTTQPGFQSPVYAYSHSAAGTNGGCAVTGGTFYAGGTFPAPYPGKYFFADYCRNYIKTLDPNNPAAAPVIFATNTTTGVVGMAVSGGGSLYYLARGAAPNQGTVMKIDYQINAPPAITQNPADLIVGVGQPAAFTCGASSSIQPLTYQWERNNGAGWAPITGATTATYTIAATALTDDGAQFRCVATNAAGSTPSLAATLTVLNNQAPVGIITNPVVGTTYMEGDTINFDGTATDFEDGVLGPAAFTWWVDLYHQPSNQNIHVHPVVPITTGTQTGSFTVPIIPHSDGVFWYRIYLRVQDSVGLTHQIFRDVMPHNMPNPLVDPQPAPQPQIQIFDPAISKIGSPAPGGFGLVGEQITWEITAVNVGALPGLNIVISDTLSSELRVDRAETSSGTATVSGNTVTFNIPVLNPAETVNMRIITTVLRSNVDGTIINIATLTGQDRNGTLTTRTATAQVRLVTGLPQTGVTPLYTLALRLGILALAAGVIGYLIVRRRRSLT